MPENQKPKKNEKKPGAVSNRMPGGAPWMENESFPPPEHPAPMIDPHEDPDGAWPEVSDPPVPNRAHTEMRKKPDKHE